jgi:hypothetical protein
VERLPQSWADSPDDDSHPGAELVIHAFSVTQRSPNKPLLLGIGWAQDIRHHWTQDAEGGPP